MQAKKQFEIEEFKKIVSEYREERAKVEAMNPQEREKYLAERE
jgi:transaldolase